jgi:ubiquinone/menaquinone biosynthesis C-methylase UbiE
LETSAVLQIFEAFLFAKPKSSKVLDLDFINSLIVNSEISIMDKEYAEYLLEETRKNYNLTAESYTRSRSVISEELQSLSNFAKRGDVVLDSGCASGRFYGVLKEKNINYSGIDISESLIKIAKKNYPGIDFRVGNAMDMPFTENYFDKIYSISVIHNIPSGNFQMQYLKELKRVLKPGGLLIMRVWDLWPRKNFWQSFIKYSFLKIIGKSKADFGDIFLPWKDQSGRIVAQRYFHAFTESEIENLVKEAGLKIKKIWRDGQRQRRNIYLIAEK